MDYTGIITLIGSTAIILYVISKIMGFYNVSSSDYSIYIAFYIFMAACMMFLPNDVPK